MASTSPLVIGLAKAYAFRLEMGYTPAEAQAYIRKTFPEATDNQRQTAYRQARRGAEVAAELEQLGPQEQLYRALGSHRRPAETVGIRVKATLYREEGGTEIETGYRDLYVESRWTDTIQDVYDRVQQWAINNQTGSGGATRVTVEFVGPSLWPGASTGLSLEGF